MDCRSFSQRQRAILFAPVSGSGATIGLQCTIVEIDPESKRRHPTDATHWRVCVFLPHVPEYREVYARDLLGLKEVLSKTPAKWAEPAPPVTSQIPSQYTGVIAAAVFFGLLWIAPSAALVVVAVSLLIFVAAIFWSAVRHQQPGW